jgi:hypothetical protein
MNSVKLVFLPQTGQTRFMEFIRSRQTHLCAVGALARLMVMRFTELGAELPDPVEKWDSW